MKYLARGIIITPKREKKLKEALEREMRLFKEIDKEHYKYLQTKKGKCLKCGRGFIKFIKEKRFCPRCRDTEAKANRVWEFELISGKRKTRPDDRFYRKVLKVI